MFNFMWVKKIMILNFSRPNHGPVPPLYHPSASLSRAVPPGPSLVSLCTLSQPASVSGDVNVESTQRLACFYFLSGGRK